MAGCNLLNAAHVPAEDQVEVVKVQLADLARTWWLAEEERLRFYESFYERFIPKTARREMEQQFINLRLGSQTVHCRVLEAEPVHSIHGSRR